MENLRVREEKKYKDSYGTGDKQCYTIYHIVKDLDKSKFNYSDEVLHLGKTIAICYTLKEAEMIKNALINTKIKED